MDTGTVYEKVRALSERFAQDRAARQRQRKLMPSDFDELRKAGFHLAGVPVDAGGMWEDAQRSTRPVAEMLRVLARGDSSVALVSSMHPSVLSFWLTTPTVAPSSQGEWDDQRRRIFQSVLEGAWWGTITSEPGSGGDITRTKATARPDPSNGTFRLTGQKQFGSGSGITSYMITTAVPATETSPDLFFLEFRGVPWDRSAGVTLLAEWDGHGMIATQSHSFLFEDFPATRSAWPGHLDEIVKASGGFIGCCFAAVIVGIVEVAVETAHKQLERWHGAMRAYEQVEWSRVEMDGWLIRQAFEGMLRATEQGQPLPDVIRGKMAIAELAESTLARICRIIGGGTYSRHSPFGFWAQDVRALGFLRPPWSLAYAGLFEQSWNTAE